MSAPAALAFGFDGDGEHAFDRADGAFEREFADDDGFGEREVLAAVFGAGNHTEGDGQVVAGPSLRRSAGARLTWYGRLEMEAAVGEGGLDAFAGFFDGGVGQADDDGFLDAEGGVHFDGDFDGLHTVDRG